MLVVTLLLFFSSVQAQQKPHYDSIAQQGWGNCLISDVWVAADYSDSMDGFEPYLFEGAKAIGQGLLHDNTQARVGMVVFNDEQRVVQKPTNSIQKLLQSVEKYQNLEGSGGTNMAGVFKFIDEKQKTIEPNPSRNNSDFKKIIIIISDGEANSPIRTKEVTSTMKKNGSWWILSIYVGENDGNEKDHNINFEFLKNISGNSQEGSSYIDSVELENLSDFFTKTFSCL